MSIYAGLDVSDKTTHICVVDVDGKVLRRDVVASDPDALAKWLNRHCVDLVCVVLETGPLSTFLYHGLVERGVAVECICARHAKGVLSARVNKSDVHDAEGLAQLARTGWYKRVHMKASATHIDRAALRIRTQLITARTYGYLWMAVGLTKLLSFGAGPDRYFSNSALYGRQFRGNAVAEIVALDSHVRPVPCAFVQPIVPLKRRT